VTPPNGIWAAWAEIRVPDGSSSRDVDAGLPGPGLGFVNAFVPADSEDHFREMFETWLAAENIELVQLEVVQPLHSVLNVDEDLMDAAVQSVRSGEVTPVFYVPEDPAKWDEDPDVDLLRASVGRPDLISYRYIADDRFEFGFVIAASDEWVLIHAVDDERIELDGHTFSRLDEVIDASVVEDSEFFARRALALAGEAPVTLAIPLDNHRTIFTGVQQSYPLVRFSLKNNDDDDEGDRVGLIANVGPNSLTIQGVSRGAEWVSIEEYDYDDITSIRVGRAYEQALASLVGPPP
jgi:hypothetical protein